MSDESNVISIQNGDTASMLAFKRAQLNEVQTLIALGSDVNAKNNDGDTALILACDCLNNEEIIQTLIDAGADVNVKNNTGDTALMVASKNGNLNTVKILIAAGADVNASNNHGYTPLLLACTYILSPDLIQTLLLSGADINARTNNS